MRKFLVALSGARPEVLAKCPTERGKFEGIGGAVLTTSVLAAISMWFALSSALGVHPLLALPAALIWGLAIMSLDRWLVGSIPAEGARRWRLAVPRILMALLLGAVISTPLVLQIFRSEIDAQIVEIKQRRANEFLQDQQRGTVGQQVASWRKSVADLQKVVASEGDVPLDPSSDPRIRSLTVERDGQQQQSQRHYVEWQCQLYGGPNCPRKGDGPLAQVSKDAYNKAKQRVVQLNSDIDRRKKQLTATDDASKKVRLDQARNDLPKSQAQLDAAVQRQSDLQRGFDAENKAADGLLIRLEALNEVSGEDVTLKLAQLLLFMVFLLIECLPVTVKLMQKPGNYDKVLAIAAKQELRTARESYGPGSRAGAGSPATAAVRDIWYREKPVQAQEQSSPTVQAPQAGPSATTLDHQIETSGEHTSLDDVALREMEDTRTTRTADGRERSGGIELFADEDDY